MISGSILLLAKLSLFVPFRVLSEVRSTRLLHIFEKKIYNPRHRTAKYFMAQ